MIGLTIAVLVVVLIAAAIWLAVRALSVKTELDAAQRVVSAIQDGAPMQERIEELGGHASSAAAAANDPVWRAAEWIPVAGENLRAVRLAAESLDVLSNDLGAPVLSVLDEDAAESPVSLALPILQDNAARVSALADEVSSAATSSSLIGPVRSGIEQVDAVLQVAAPAVAFAPSLLGADGPKNYLLAFQNNAESLALGGSAASQTLITADAGRISVTAQASSANFEEGSAVDVAVDQSAIDLYGSYLVDHVNTATSRPDFPTAAQILRAFWQRDISADRIDAVISIDPIALGRILKATGPITVGEVEITTENAVSVLLRDVYEWWDPYASKAEAAASDAFFAAVAQTVFEKLSTGDFDLKDMGWAISSSIDSGDVLMWSDDASLAGLLGDGRVTGQLPTDNTDATTTGVFFRDTSRSKIDYYMDSAVDVAETCEGSTHTFTASTTLHLNLSQEDADDLPRYVKSGQWGSEQFRTEVFVYGPPGTTISAVSVDGRDVRDLSTSIVDLGRPVAYFETYLRPDERATVTASFSGEGDFGEPDVRTTPMVRGTDVRTSSACG